MKRLASQAVATALLAYGVHASAELPEPRDTARAHALFYEARALMKDGFYAVACLKLEESLRLDYGIGTEFNLADCNEKIGKIASAWSGFSHVVAAAKAQNQPERERLASERARSLDPRLPKLLIEVPSGPATDLEIKRDGILLRPAALGIPVPVDPGTHRLTVAVPGKRTWESIVAANEGTVTRVIVPRELPAVAAVSGPAASTPTGPGASAAPGLPDPVIEHRGGTQRALGWVVGGLGIAGIGIGVGFGIDSLQKRERAREHCTGDLCNRRGVELREQAIARGDVATIATIAGGAALVGGALLALTAPRDTSRNGVIGRTSLRAIPHVARNGGGITLEGVVP